MTIATLTSKGQVTVPQVVRKALGLHAGDKLDFVHDERGGFRVVALRKEASVLRGRFANRAARSVSIEDMADAVQAEATARAR